MAIFAPGFYQPQPLLSLAQAIANLLTNAWRFTPQGGRVGLIIAREDDEVVIRVLDNGEGIDADRLPGLFDLFAHADLASRVHGGLGTGNNDGGAAPHRLMEEAIAALLRDLKARGWSHFKIKVGRDLRDDLRRSSVLRAEMGPDARMMIDANQVWDVPQAIEWMKHLARFEPWWIEEPTSPDDVLGHAAIARAVAWATYVGLGLLGLIVLLEVGGVLFDRVSPIAPFALLAACNLLVMAYVRLVAQGELGSGPCRIADRLAFDD